MRYSGAPNAIDVDCDPAAEGTSATELGEGLKFVGPDVHHTVEFARCFLHLANLPNWALDRLSRYEATLWRQTRQTLLALDALDRRNPQEGRRGSQAVDRRELLANGYDERRFRLR